MNAHELPLAPLVRGRVASLSPVRESLDIDGVIERWCAGEDVRADVHLAEQLRDHLRDQQRDHLRDQQRGNLAGVLRDPLAAAPAGPTGVHVALVHRGRVITCEQGMDEAAAASLGERRPPFRRLLPATRTTVRALRAAEARTVFLGIDSRATLRVGLLIPEQVDLADVEGLFAADPTILVESLRTHAHTLDDDDTQCALELSALAHWHDASRFCSRCAGRLVSAHCGWVLACEGCQGVEYPRQDPAMIVAVTNQRGQILLAHNALWEDKRVSVLAGFVDAGEAPERAVVREIAEEVGLNVTDVTFQGTQPWPFPRSLMLAYSARVVGDDTLTPDTSEIAWAEWFDPTSLEQAVAVGRIILPGVNTIAYGLISRWYGAELPQA